MSRNRIIYNVLALYAGKNNAISGSHSNAGDIKQLTRVQSFDEDFARNLTNVNQYGNLAAIDRIEITAPTVKSSFSYYITDGGNENFVGLNVATGSQSLVSCVSGYLTKATDQKNYFLLISDEGHDAAGYTNARTGVIGIGNGFLTSYDVEAAVGQIPKATVQLEALNVRVYSNADGTNDVPAVNPINGLPVTGVPFLIPAGHTNDSNTQISALQPGDITLDINGLIGVNKDDLKIQNFKLNIPLARQPIMRLGNKFAFTREIQWPVKTTFSIDAELGDIQDGNLADVLCQTGTYDINVGFRKPDCSGHGQQALVYNFRGAKLLNQKVNTSLGQNAKFTAEFEAQIGAPEDLAHGVFISGTYAA
jgi:hypothetical protein